MFVSTLTFFCLPQFPFLVRLIKVMGLTQIIFYSSIYKCIKIIFNRPDIWHQDCPSPREGQGRTGPPAPSPPRSGPAPGSDAPPPAATVPHRCLPSYGKVTKLFLYSMFYRHHSCLYECTYQWTTWVAIKSSFIYTVTCTLHLIQFEYKGKTDHNIKVAICMWSRLELHRILIWPDIRLNSNIEFFFRKKCTFI